MKRFGNVIVALPRLQGRVPRLHADVGPNQARVRSFRGSRPPQRAKGAHHAVTYFGSVGIKRLALVGR